MKARAVVTENSFDISNEKSVGAWICTDDTRTSRLKAKRCYLSDSVKTLFRRSPGLPDLLHRP